MHASNTARLEQSYRKIADQIKVRGRQNPQANVFRLVHDWLQNKKNGPWLLVFDNADDLDVLGLQSSNEEVSQARNSGDCGGGAPQQQLLSYWPPSRHGSVLVTSRTRRVAVQLVDDSDVIPIGPMDHAAAHALLYQKLGSCSKESDSRTDLGDLAMALDYMPLALVQAASYIRERWPRCSVQQYIKEYRQNDSKATSLLNQAAGHLRRDKSASNAILITWQVSFDHVRSTRKSAAELLSLMSFFDQQGIPEALVHTNRAAEHDSFEDDVLMLRDYSLITVLATGDMFKMHGLVQLATRKWLESQEQLEKWREQYISNLCAELPKGTYENWEKCQALFPHARAALAQRPVGQKSLREWALLLYNAAWYAWEMGRAGEAEQMSITSMKATSEVLGYDNEETLRSMSMVGMALDLGGNYKEAETINNQALAIYEKVLGPEHPETLSSMTNLAYVLNKQGKYSKAEVMHRQALVIREKVLGHEHPDTLLSMNGLALALSNQSKGVEAEGIYRQTLATREKVLGYEHPNTLTSKYNLALALCIQNKHREAEEMYRQTLEQQRKVLGPEHPNSLMSMNGIALALSYQGKHQKAEEMYRMTLEQQKKVSGPEHPNTLMGMQNLALTLSNQNKDQEAEGMYRQILEQQERVLGNEHPDTLLSVYNLASQLAKQSRYDDSLAFYDRACAGYTICLGDDHPTTRTCYENHSIVLTYLEQVRICSYSAKADNGVSIRNGKASRLSRRLARLRTSISKPT